MKFKIGDLIKAIDDTYGVTGLSMKVGIVREIKDSRIRVEVLEHRNPYSVGDIYWVNSKRFVNLFNCDNCDIYNICDKKTCSKE